jgi:uncharacterized repeat protein (TIGR01451 family)/fimbrial isopeptide formation D2 family protein
VVWNLGALAGQAALTATVTAVLQDVATSYHGVVLTNQARLSYRDEGQPYAFAATAAVTVSEPLLHIGKSYVTDAACGATLLQDNFNAGLTGYATVNGTWSAANGWLLAPTNADSRIIRSSGVYSDFSLSGIFTTTDTSGDLGFIFRAQDINNYYRFVWNRGGANNYRIERVEGSTVTTIGAPAGAAYTTHRWTHVEVRAVGTAFTVFINGQQALAVTDSAAPWSSGSVGFYANNQNRVAYDDLLVTRMGDAGCFVDTGDLITYTLTISNQAWNSGYNLVITDVMPAHVAYVSSSLTSNDPNAALTLSPTPGDMGALVWTMNQLTPTTPFNPLQHTWATLTVTARIVEDVAAGLRLTNQALLAYDSQAGAGPAGVQRAYSGGSHSTAVRTADPVVIKSTAPVTVTIGQSFQYTLTFPGDASGIAATLYTATLTDSLPAGFRMIGAPQVTVAPPANIAPADISSTRSTTKTVLVDFTRIPSYTQATVVITAVVENLASNQDGVRYTNTATLGWLDRAGAPVPPVTSNPVTTDLIEPQLVIEKFAFPTSAEPGDTIFYTLRIYHALTSTIPAYNVLISDTLSSQLSYISGSWESNNDPLEVASTGYYTVVLPTLRAYFPVISTTLTADNPLIIRYQGVVKLETTPGKIITNVADVRWTSLFTDTFGEVRNGSGGVNDYRTEDTAEVSLDQFEVVKTGPVTATAGSRVTYVIRASNGSPMTGTNAFIVDEISYQVRNVTGTLSAPLGAGPCNPPLPDAHGTVIHCNLGDMPPYSTAVVTITGEIDPATPDGSLVHDYATFIIIDSNGVQQEHTDDADTHIETASDLALDKRAPVTANAGELITYTLVVTNNGPSHAHGVDIKDMLPPGLTYVGGSVSQGACTSGICQVGEMAFGQVVTMVITASVGSEVSGVITNTGQVFAATHDPDPSNNRDTASSTILAITTIHVSKLDFADPVYAGDSFLYQLLVTNTGPALARNVILTDTLPTPLVYQGGSPGCDAVDGQVVCAAGDMPPGGWYGFLINVAVPNTITTNSVVTNLVELHTTTQIVTATSVLSDREPTTLLQKVGNPTDLQLTKQRTPAALVAGAPANSVITYTIIVTNAGTAPASGVNVFDLYPTAFDLVSIRTSKALTEAECTVAGGCVLGSLEISETAVITIVMRAGAGVAAGTYTNTAFVASAARELNPNNNSSSVPVVVTRQIGLQIDKQVAPDPVLPGEELTYLIVVTNTGPSLATGVTVSDTLPAAFAPLLVLSSQGGCAALPCTLGELSPGAVAWIQLHGATSPDVTTATQLANTAHATAAEDPVGVRATVTPTLSSGADLAVTKAGAATAAPGDTLLYTLTVANLGPSRAQSVRVTDTLPAGLTFAGAASGCAAVNGVVTCLLTDLAADASQTFTVAAVVSNTVAPGTSLENVVTVAANTPDANLTNNRADADTSILGKAAFTIAKQQLAPAGAVTAGELVTYTIVVTNVGPGLARAVDVKDQLPPALSLAAISAQDGLCAGAVCQFGQLAAGASRTITVTARVAPGSAADVITNTAAVYSTDSLTTPTASATTPIVTAAALRITKTALGSPVNAGDTALYQLVVTNDGPSTARGVLVTDTLPTGLSFAGGDVACSAAGQVIRCGVGDLDAGASRSLLVQASVAGALVDGVTLTNLVTATSPTATNAPTATATITVRQPVASEADLAVSKRGPATVTAGEEIVYTLVITNHGLAAATGVNLVDALPDGVIFVAATSSQGLCEAGVSCQLGELSVGVTATVVVTGVVAGDVVSGTTLLNLAQVSSANRDTNLTNNAATAATLVSASARLTLIKAVSPALVEPGATLHYRIVVTNSGPSAAANVVVADTLPAAIEAVTVSSSQGGCTAFPCALGDIAADGSATILIVARVVQGAAGSFTNTASLTTDTPLTGDSITTGSAVAVAATVADVALRLQSTPTTYAGTTAVVTATVTNIGPSAAEGAVVTITLPASVSYGGDLLPAGWNVASSVGDTVVLTTADPLAAGAAVNLPITVTVASTVPPGASLEFNGVLTTITADPDPTNNRDDADTSVLGLAAFAIVKRQVEPVGAVAAGALVTYTITFTNTGPGTARTVDVKDQLPAGLSLISASAGVNGFCAGALCQFGSLPLNATRTMTVVARVDNAAAAQTVTNVAAVYSVDAAGATTATVTTTVAPVAALRITKTAFADTVYAGGAAIYQLVVANDGPSDAQNVVVTDTLPAGLSYTGGDAACTATGQELRCVVGSLIAGASRSLLIQTTAAGDLGDGVQLTNLVTATSPTATNAPTATATITVRQSIGGEVDLTVSKRGPATVIAGAQIVYTLVITNNGPATATAVSLVDALPDGVAFAAATSSQGLCEAGVSCQLGALADGATATVVVTGVVGSDVLSGTTLLNLARVDGANPDTNPNNNTTAATTLVTAAARMNITKLATPALATPGAAVTYRIVVTNSGPSAAANVVVADVLPAEIDAAAVSSSQGGCTGFPCVLGDIAPDSSASILVVGALATDATGIFTNTASLTTDTPLASGSGTSATAPVSVAPQADLALDLASTPTTIAGTTATVTATVTNIGPSAAEGAVVTITLPAGVTYGGELLPAGWNVAASVGNTIVLTTADPLAAGAVVNLPITVTVAADAPPGSSVQFAGVLTATTADPDPTNNRADADTSVIGLADLSVSKRGPATATAGALVTYTVVVTNAGPTVAVLQDIKDTLPAGITLLSAELMRADGTLTACAAGICQAGGGLAVGEVVTMTVAGRVAADVTAGAILTDTATAFTDGVTPDPNLANNQATLATTIDAAAALRVTKTALNSPVYAGDVIFYQITVYNDGPSDAQAVTITDTLPLSTTYAGGDASCSAAGGVVACAVGKLAAGGFRALLIQARTDAATADGLAVTNIVTATSPTAATPVTATVDVIVRQPLYGAVDLVIEKQAARRRSRRARC